MVKYFRMDFNKATKSDPLYIGLFCSENSMNKLSAYGVCVLCMLLMGCGGSANAPLLTSPALPANPTGSTGPTGPSSQSIDFFPDRRIVLGSTSLVAKASSELPITYVSQHPTVCTVSGVSITAVSLGTCTLTANQAGNASYNAAPEVVATIYVVATQSVNSFVIPPISVGIRAVLNLSATSNLPVVLSTETPGVCVVEQNIIVRGVRPGNCGLAASQFGNTKYATAPLFRVSTTVAPSNTSLTANAVLAPWITTPEPGSTTQDSMTSLEGLYSNASGGIGLIDSANNIQYYESNRIGDRLVSLLLAGSFTRGSGDSWTLNNSTVSFPQITAITASGTFLPKQSFTATAQSFSTASPFLDLVYATDNGFAASPTSPNGSWLYNDGGIQFNLTVSATGVITGTATNILGAGCTLSGSIQQTEPTSQHNLYRISLTTADAPSELCALGTTRNYTGLAALSFLAAGDNASNGYLPSLVVIANSSTPNAPLFITLFRP